MDAEFLIEKDTSYGGSWKKRGGVGAFMMLARKWDRLETMLAKDYDIFKAIDLDYSGNDGTILAEVRDLRRYLLLVEAEMLSRELSRAKDIEPEQNIPGTPENGGHHAQAQED
jgi:hypothetical protein